MFKTFTEAGVCIINHHFIGVSLNKHFIYIVLLNLDNTMKYYCFPILRMRLRKLREVKELKRVLSKSLERAHLYISAGGVQTHTR